MGWFVVVGEALVLEISSIFLCKGRQPSNSNHQTTEPDKLSGIHGIFGKSI